MATTSPRPEPGALAATLTRALTGATCQQIRGPAVDGVVQLQLYLGRPAQGPRKVLLDVWARAGVAGAWRTERRRQNRVPQGSFVMFLRKHLRGARLVLVTPLGEGLAFGWRRGGRGDVAERAVGWLVALPEQLQWVEPSGRVRMAWPGRADLSGAAALDLSALTAADERPATDVAERRPAATGAAVAEDTLPVAGALPISGPLPLEGALQVSDAERAAQRRAEGEGGRQSQRQVGVGLARALRSARKRQRRLVSALRGDLAQASEADALREQGEVLKCQLDAVPQGADSVQLPVPWEPPRQVHIALRRDLTPAANLARIFRRARGFSRRQGEIGARLASAEARLAELERLAAATRALTPGPDAAAAVAALCAEAAPLGVRVHTPAPPGAPQKARARTTMLPSGVQRWTSPAGDEVLVGRNAKANDVLVTRLARGRDVWMHVRGRAGAHLLLRRQKGATTPNSVLSACAMLCAWASGVARGDRVDVTWTEARHVRKVKGTAPGLVYVSEEKTLYVEVVAEVIDAFRARREAERAR